jgi:hypothetical protein
MVPWYGQSLLAWESSVLLNHPRDLVERVAYFRDSNRSALLERLPKVRCGGPNSAHECTDLNTVK